MKIIIISFIAGEYPEVGNIQRDSSGIPYSSFVSGWAQNSIFKSFNGWPHRLFFYHLCLYRKYP